jgi:mRNA-degrading endonuclease YafQ of YafQ-DinJ toxin-antitoxin module
MEVYYSSRFLRQLKKLPQPLQDEVIEKIELFKDIKNHKQLKVHILTGKFATYHSFSVNYAHRIIFDYLEKDEVVLLKVGDHDIYDKI